MLDRAAQFEVVHHLPYHVDLVMNATDLSHAVLRKNRHTKGDVAATSIAETECSTLDK